jgi:hypothetical protein
MPPENTTLKQEISETREELGQNLTELEYKLKAGWEEVKQNFSPTYQTQQHPWMAVGVSVVVGAAVGSLVVAPRSLDSRGGQAQRNFRSTFSSNLGSGLDRGLRRGREFVSQFDDEFGLVKGMLLTSALQAVGAWTKRIFPSGAESIDHVFKSAILKVKPDSEAKAEGAKEGKSSADETQGNVVGRPSGLRSAGELRSKERSWRPSEPSSAETDLA